MSRESSGAKLIANILSMYMMTVFFAGAYFNWQYANENGFVKWLLLGEIVPTAKAIVWPYFAAKASHPDATAVVADSGPSVPRRAATSDTALYASNRREQVIAEVRKAFAAMESSQKATRLLNSRRNLTLAEMPDLQQIVAHRRTALTIADTVDTAVLDSIYPEFGTRFSAQFKEALKLFVDACERGSDAALVSSRLLNDEWADWYMGHRQQIEEATNRAIH